jgi:hypothetical protein
MENMLIKLEHLKDRNASVNPPPHNLDCTREWFIKYGLDFKEFVRRGMFSDDLIAASGGVGHDPELTAFLTWIENSGPISIEKNRKPPTDRDVNIERERRLLAGKVFYVPGYGSGIRVKGDADTTRNLQALGFAAQLRLAQGDTTHITQYRDQDNILHDLVPGQVLALWSVASTYVSELYQSSWLLKDDSAGIPVDYQDDVYWPDV